MDDYPSTILQGTIAPDSDGHSSNDEETFETQSLSASVTDYPMHWGRRYHRYREGSYHFPNDEPEIERLEVQHQILQELYDGRFYFSPLDTLTTVNVIDIGTGTGTWPINLAEANCLPNAKITGIDLSAIQPNFVPENVTFEIQDISDEDWYRPLDSLDFVHSRYMAGSLASYRALIRNTRRYLRPGTGWLELHELSPRPISDDNSIPPDWKLVEWEENLHYASKHCLDPPRPVRVATHLREWMQQAGYVDVHEHIFKIPIGPWPRDRKLKDIGRVYSQNFLAGLPGFSYKLFGLDGLGWTRNEIELHLAEVRNSMMQKSVHAYFRDYIVYGRRPSEGERLGIATDTREPAG